MTPISPDTKQVAIVSMTTLTLAALYMGYDHVTLGVGMGIVSGIAGYQIGCQSVAGAFSTEDNKNG